MTLEEWQALQDAFAEALKRDDAGREEFVAAFEADRPELGRKLRDLLTADAANSDTELRQPIEDVAGELARESQDPWVGRRIGAWTITRRLAGGGMGAVFLAERSDRQYSQTVAVKVMAAQLVAPEAISRFRAERQILANLDHPYIARLIDGGSTDDGVPYLVMDYVEGLPIDRHCDQYRLGIEQRLALFRKVCEAVDYAHRKLVVHRDLKPSNILVDASGNPRLLDFGIAKLLEAGSYAQTIAVTRAGARAMTPEYASPEQVRGETVSVATDVYSLGVLLFRLLTGQSPYGNALTTPGAYERAIVETDPRRPSTVVTAADTDPAAGERRRMSTERLRRLLAGDLDNIVLKALQKDPERRYPSARLFADDVGRFLRHEPVDARGDDWAYIARKFMRRHAGALATAIAVLATIAALVTFYTLRLAAERDRANLAAAQSGEVTQFLTGLFESASPHQSKGDVVTAIELLQQGAERVGALEDQPELQAELARIMGSNMTALGYLKESIPMLEMALEAKRSMTPPDALSIAETLHNLAEAQRQLGQSDAAELHMREALEIFQTTFGPGDERTLVRKGRLGVILFDMARPQEALALEQEVLQQLVAKDEGESPFAIDMRGNIANALDRLGRYDEAAAMHEEAIALSERVEGELAPNTIIRMANLGLVMTRQGRMEEAVSQFGAALERGYKVWPPTNDQIAFILGAQAAVLKRLGRMDESLAQYRQAAEITRGNLGEDNLRYVARLRGIGALLTDMARYEEAEQTYLRALDIAVRLSGEENPRAVELNVHLGRHYVQVRRFEEAETALRKALARKDLLQKSIALIALRELGTALSEQGRFDEAQPLLLEALPGQDATGADKPTSAPYLSALASHYRRSGDLQQALTYAERAYPLAHAEAATGQWSAAAPIAEYARTLNALGRTDEAKAYFSEAHALLQKTFGDEDPRVVELALSSRGP